MKLKLLALSFVVISANIVLCQEEINRWHLLDVNEDKKPGVSHAQALEIVEGKKAQSVIVAVIDGGIDTNHIDLRANLWVNEDEIRNNGIDDDGNGYIDDIYGWNFIGGDDGNVEMETMELTRMYRKLKFMKWEGKLQKDSEQWSEYESLKKEYNEGFDAAKVEYAEIDQIYKVVMEYHAAVSEQLGKEDYSLNEVKNIKSADEKLSEAAEVMTLLLKDGLDFGLLEEYHESLENEVKFYYNLEFNPRDIVGDDPDNFLDTIYGNNDVMGKRSDHGTHVSGIIGAVRDNNEGIDGIAMNVQLMTLRAVPDGDERDKDVALAIRYAVNNGADIINMSFGKYFSPNSIEVQEAIAYAEKHEVIMVHAAGNEAKNIDEELHFPTQPFQASNQENKYWIEVGASAPYKNKYMVAEFSNYGKNTVDIYAPGVDIYSCKPGSKYESSSGTSMAAPVVSGVVALLLNYYPEIDRSRIKDLVLNSGIDYSKQKVFLPNEENGKPPKVRMGELSNSGKIINAAELLRMANETM
ncbi:MAG: S8 family peptidase [Schleiferiaceae bacterium]|jgi:subtilisin family serine protease|nr:S8 family peptidase [Schleiferiaceae bacterium]